MSLILFPLVEALRRGLTEGHWASGGVPRVDVVGYLPDEVRTEVKVPRLIAWRVMTLNQISTWLSHATRPA